MILSASGWRKVFAQSGDGNDKTTSIGSTNKALCALIAETFSQYITEKTGKKNPVVVVGIDTRPTGNEIADVIIRVLCQKVRIEYLGISSAPEIMAYSRQKDGFLYISASHNPIGHNGIKFGLNDGGVLPGSETKILADSFRTKCAAVNAEEHAAEITASCSQSEVKKIYKNSPKYKAKAVKAYEDFIRTVISGTEKQKEQKAVFETIKTALAKRSLSIVCDMNGSSRTLSIDKNFLPSCGINFLPFNNEPGQIVHEIIPEPENLVHCARRMEELHSQGKEDALLGYMPDCDGDRGNIVYWDEKEKKAKPIPAQEVFALCVMAELSFEIWKSEKNASKMAVAVNCPTSMRIDEICNDFGASLFRAEVGEANVVNLAREKRAEGYNVRILGEGSNGGNITNPSCVRDPVATIFAMVKLLTVRDIINKDGSIHKGIFHLWCEKSGQMAKYKPEFTLSDVIATLPVYTTTGVSESRAVLKVKTEDKGKLKLRFQKIFEQQWKEHCEELKDKYGFAKWECDTTNGTKETKQATEWNNGNGGLKIKFLDETDNALAFIWMRPSGTEPVFRVMCDVKGAKAEEEKSLLQWETSILNEADSIGE